MGLPTLVNGPYIFNVNNRFYCDTVDIKCRTMLFQMKEALVAMGGAGSIWSVVASTDTSSVKNVGDADPDLWVDYEDVVDNSWIVLENSTTGGQLCIDRATSAWYAYIYYSPGGTFSDDGTTSTRPTDTDSRALLDTTESFTTNTSTYVNFALHAMMSADHKTTRVFIQERNSSGSEEGGFTLLIEELSNTHSYWTSTNKTAISYNPTTINYSATPGSISPTIDELSSGYFAAFVETDDPYAGWDSFYMTCECYSITAGATGIASVNLNTDLRFLDGFPINPMGCYRPGAVDRGGAIGRFRDLYLSPYYHPNLSSYPSDVTRQWVKIGALLVPWNGTAPLKV